MRRWFYVLVAAQLAFLLAQAGRSELDLRRGQIVVLKTAPVDPRSLFMGNYMQLGYDISQLDLTKLKHDSSFGESNWGKDIYVVLRPGKPYAQPVRVTTLLPKGEPLPYLHGRGMHTDDEVVWVKYGLERYYIPETRKEEVNRMSGWGSAHPPQIAVEVVVTRNGRGLIRRILVDGKPLAF